MYETKYSRGSKTELGKPNAILIQNLLKVRNRMFRFRPFHRSKSERKNCATLGRFTHKKYIFCLYIKQSRLTAIFFSGNLGKKIAASLGCFTHLYIFCFCIKRSRLTAFWLRMYGQWSEHARPSEIRTPLDFEPQLYIGCTQWKNS